MVNFMARASRKASSRKAARRGERKIWERSEFLKSRESRTSSTEEKAEVDWMM
jgi:hypothetical protein